MEKYERGCDPEEKGYLDRLADHHLGHCDVPCNVQDALNMYMTIVDRF